MKKITYITFIAIMLFCSCKRGNASVQSDNSTNENQAIANDTITTFTYPKIPTMYREPEQRADYLIKHYWDHLNFADTNYIHHPEVTEQAFVDYLSILDHISVETAGEEIKKTLTKASIDKKVYNYLTNLADRYLYEPNSPFRNEDYYIPVLEHMIASTTLESAEKIRPTKRLELAKKNRKGTKALNFTYTLDSGKQGTLHKINSDYVLLFFNNPDCRTCYEISNKIKFSLQISRAISDNKMAILCFYPDQEIELWKKHANDYPKEWIYAYDKSYAVTEKNLYDLRAIPTLYLLDKNKQVLLKDTTVEEIENYLRSL